MTQITGKIYQQTNAAGTENRFPRTVMEAVLGLNSYLQDQFGSLADIYMPIEGISESKPNQEFVFRKTPNTIKAKALTLDKIKGKTLAWNQLIKKEAIGGSTESYGITITNNGDGSVTYDGTSTAPVFLTIQANLQDRLVPNHKYFVTGATSQIKVGDIFSDQMGTLTSNSIWTSPSALDTFYLGAIISTGVTVSNVRCYYNFIDLTLMFGAGNEPSTVAEFESLYPGYHAYNPGTLISNDAESLETVGFNQWDEEWKHGTINPDNGEELYSDEKICNNGYIPAFGGLSYCITYGNYISDTDYVYFYDENKNYIGFDIYTHTGSGTFVFTTPNNCRFIRFIMAGTTYNHDICINVSDPARNGQYEPYKKSVCPLNIKTRTGKLNGQGASVVVFPDGARGAGTAFDEARREGATLRFGSIDLGQIPSWRYTNGCWYAINYPVNYKHSGSNGIPHNIIASKYAHGSSYNGVASEPNTIELFGILAANEIIVNNGSSTERPSGMLYYELAEPQEYVWDEPMPMSTNAGITESRISPNADGISAPMCCDITYGMGASDYATDAEYASYAGNAQYAEVAARLLTPRTIWGQVFDGSANITGAMTGVSSIDSLMHFDTSNGRIGIGISTPLYNLDVAGTFHAAGNVEIGGTLISRTNPSILHSISSYGEVEIDSETELTLNRFDIDEDGNAAFEMASVRDCLRLRYYSVDAHEFSDSDVSFDGDHVSFQNPLSAPRYDSSSDQRLKTNLSPVALTVEQIASAPAVEFNWVGNGQRGAGSIAQYWEGLLPYNVHHNGDLLTMEYGNIALLSAITCARKIQELEAKIKELESRIS